MMGFVLNILCSFSLPNWRFSLAFFNSSEVQRETVSVLCHGNSSIMGLFLELYRFHYWLFRSCAGNCVQNSSPKTFPQCNSRHYRPSLSSTSSKWPKRYRKSLVTAQLHLSGVWLMIFLNACPYFAKMNPIVLWLGHNVFLS